MKRRPTLFNGYWRLSTGGKRRVTQTEMLEVWRLWARHRDIREGRPSLYRDSIAPTHECFYRGCKDVVPAETYHCKRHEEILARQRAIGAKSNSENARRRREQGRAT